MKKIFALMAVLSAQAMAAQAETKAPEPRPYDYDLFSKDRETVYADLEAVVWKLLNNQAIGLKFNQPINAPLTGEPGTPSQVINMNWKWRPGFRVTVGYFNAPKYWEVMGQYTWFQDSASKSVISPGTSSQHYLKVGGYTPAALSSPYQLLQNPVECIHAKGDLYYNDFSTLVARNFYPNPHLRLRVLGGLTSLWAHQDTHVSNEFFNVPASLDYDYHSKYWGVGFKMGTGADWYWGKDFYLTGKVFWAIVTGRWNTQTKVSQSDGLLLTQPHDSSYITTQNFQFLFGPSYQKSFEKFRWELFVGYEFNSWLGALTSYNYIATDMPQDWINPQPLFQNLTLTGVNVRLTLDF